MMTHYPCKASKKVKIFTFFITLICLLVWFIAIAYLQFYYKADNMVPALVQLIFGILIPTLLFITYCYSPKNLFLDDKTLRVKCRLFKRDIPLSDIEKITKYHSVTHDIRHFGSNGLWGYIGIMENGGVKYFSHCNNPAESVMIYCKSGNYLVSCNNSDDLISKLGENPNIEIV